MKEYKELHVVEEKVRNPIEKELLLMKADNGFIAIRCSGEFEGKAFYLDSDFDWQIGIDDEKELVLVPTKKE